MTINQILHIPAQMLSILLYPLWIPTYGMMLFCLSLRGMGLPLPIGYTMLLIGSTFCLTAVVPLLIILYLKKKGMISDLYIDKAEERTLPYLFTAGCYAVWWSFMHHQLHMPPTLCLIAVGAVIAIAAVALINRQWKISAHLTGWGGLMGGIAAYYLSISHMPSLLWMSVLMGLSLLLMYARIYMQAHTPLQVVTGWLLGIMTTFIPNLLLHYA